MPSGVELVRQLILNGLVSLSKHHEVIGVDWSAGGDWTVYLSPYGVHRSDEPCPAPPDQYCPCQREARSAVDDQAHTDVDS
jgi:hypothetical protein